MVRQRTPEGPPPPPPVQKLRIRYAKRGRLRFSSTRDFSRAIERALRRARVPMAFSAGFHPHPKISYANGAPTGAASEAEYLEIRVAQRVDPHALRADLDAALPAELVVVDVVEAGPGSLADRLEASEWQIELRGCRAPDARAAVEDLLSRDVVEVTRMTKKGPRTFDVRGALLVAEVSPEDAASDPAGPPCAILRVVVRHTTPAVRPDDVLTALDAASGFTPPVPPLVTRLAQGPWVADDARVADPLSPDREAVGA